MIGRLIDGRYQVRSRIARGGMATVYLATDLRLERRVAIKVMHGHLADDNTFKSSEDLRKIYLSPGPVKPGTETVVYCRIGERSSHTWFVLTYLLGVDNVRNYDGSWTEWGNKVGAPIAKGS